MLDAYPGERTMVGEVNLRGASRLVPLLRRRTTSCRWCSTSRCSGHRGTPKRGRRSCRKPKTRSRRAMHGRCGCCRTTTPLAPAPGSAAPRPAPASPRSCCSPCAARPSSTRATSSACVTQTSPPRADEIPAAAMRTERRCRGTPRPTTGGPRHPGCPSRPRRRTATSTCWRGDRGSILHLYRALLQYRRSTTSLRTGGWRRLDAPPEVLAFERQTPGEQRRVVANFGDEPRSDIAADDGWLVDLDTDGNSRRVGRAVACLRGRHLAAGHALLLSTPREAGGLSVVRNGQETPASVPRGGGRLGLCRRSVSTPPMSSCPPRDLLAAVQAAEAAGFTRAMCSDHFAPWSERQGESSHAWVWLGAALQSTALPFGVVTAPGTALSPGGARPGHRDRWPRSSPVGSVRRWVPERPQRAHHR